MTDENVNDDLTNVDPVLADDKADDGGDVDEEAAAAEADRQQREAFYQTKYQALKEKVKNMGGDTEEEAADAFEPAPAPRRPKPVTDDFGGDLDFEQELATGRFDPARFKQELVQELKVTLRKENEAHLKKLTEREAVQTEKQAAMADIDGARTALKLTEDEAQKCFEEALAAGIDPDRKGGPTRIALITAKNMELAYTKKLLQGRTTSAATSAEDKARTALLAAQPDRGSAPPQKKRSSEQIALDNMRAVAPRDSSSLLDSQRNK